MYANSQYAHQNRKLSVLFTFAWSVLIFEPNVHNMKQLHIFIFVNHQTESVTITQFLFDLILFSVLFYRLFFSVALSLSLFLALFVFSVMLDADFRQVSILYLIDDDCNLMT